MFDTNFNEDYALELAQLIALLEKEDQERVIKYGFDFAHSYRGYYERLAFEPRRDQKVSQMLDEAKNALGSTYTGYKGGEFEMKEDTPCYIAMYGECGDPFSMTLYVVMFGDDAWYFGEREE